MTVWTLARVSLPESLLKASSMTARVGMPRPRTVYMTKGAMASVGRTARRRRLLRGGVGLAGPPASGKELPGPEANAWATVTSSPCRVSYASEPISVGQSAATIALAAFDWAWVGKLVTPAGAGGKAANAFALAR